MKWLHRLHRAWTQNDGRPWENWKAGPDLKESILIGLLILCVATMAGFVALRTQALLN